MVQATDSQESEDPVAVCRWNVLARCLLHQAEVSVILVVVADVFREQTLQVLLVHRDYLVQQLVAAALDPALRDAREIGAELCRTVA